VELLVSLTILAGLLAVTYSGFRVALTMWEKVNEQSQEFERRQTVLTVLKEQIAGILPVLYFVDVDSQRRQRVAFEGQSNHLRFVSRTSWRDGSNAVPRWIDLNWDGRLKIDERHMLSPLNTPAEQSLWKLDLDTFEAFEFRFLLRGQPNRPAAWVETWNMEERRELPAAVAIDYKTREGSTALVIPLDYADANWKGYVVQ
jgi:type II secretory pathway component PulJ